MPDICLPFSPSRAFDLSHAANPTGIRNEPWSVRLARRYELSLSEALADWFDAEVWRGFGGGEFRQPVSPAVLLNSAPEVIWPALMPPDFLPLLGNTAGDWLCARIGAEGCGDQIVHWYHGGGDWIPWGRTLAEAIVFDAVHARLPGPSRRHSVPAESPRLDAAGSLSDPLLAWAAKRVPAPVAELIPSQVAGKDLGDRMIEAGVAEVAVRCELVQAALAEPLSGRLDADTAARLGFDWHQAVRWCFDLGLIPPEARDRLREEFGLALGRSQDWAEAAEHCRRVQQLAPELAWPWELLGYAEQRRGALASAVALYRQAAAKSGFTDQSIRLRTHWTSDSAAKFSVAMLRQLAPASMSESPYLRALGLREVQARRRAVSEQWSQQAGAALADGNAAEAYRCFMAAGWDLGAGSIASYAELLDGLVDSAQQAGWAARAALAKTHRACLMERYGV